MILKKKMDPRGSSAFKMLFEGETAGNWQMDRILIILKKENGPRASCPCTGVKYHNIQICLLVYEADLR